MLKTLKNHWFSLLFGALAALGGLLKRLGAVLEASWSCLGAVLELLLLSMLLLMLLQLLRSALVSIFSCFEALLDDPKSFKSLSLLSLLKFLAP